MKQTTIRPGVDLGKAFDFFKKSILDTEAELKHSGLNSFTLSKAYGETMGASLALIQHCTGEDMSIHNPDDLQDFNIFSSPGNSPLEQELIDEMDRAKEKDNLHPTFKNIFEQMGNIVKPEKP